MRRIVAGLNHRQAGSRIPVVLFTKGGARNLAGFVDSGADAIGLDWTANLDDIKRQVGDKLALQGNLNPHILLSDPKTIDAEVQSVLASYGAVLPGQGHAFNLSHGIPPDNVSALVEAVQRHSL